MTHVFVATCAQLPALDPDDRALGTELERLGVTVEPAVWTDQSIDWRAADACIVRSTWDYHTKPKAFVGWLERVSAQTQILNPPQVLSWNVHKFYLKELDRARVPVVPSVWLERGSIVNLDKVLDEKGWLEAVIKPAYGASADGVLHVRAVSSSRSEAQQYLTRMLSKQDALLQPYLAEIQSYPERALVFIDGVYSHAVTKMPFMHAGIDLARRGHSPPGASGEIQVEPTVDEVALGTAALDASPAGHVFARVDIVRDHETPFVLEVEMIEPTLYLYAKPEAARTLARAVARRL